MLSKYYGKDETPQTINDKLKTVKGFAVGGGDYIWGSFHKVFNDIAEVKTDTPDVLTDNQINQIKSSLDQNYPVMVQLDYNPKTVANETHYVLIVDYNPSEENDFTIADPLGGKIHSLKDYLGWYKPSVRKTINQIILFTGPKPTTQNDAETYGLLVKKSTQWDLTVAYVEAGDPNHTLFENVKSIIAGLKSAVTDSQNKLNTAEANLATANQEIANRIEQIARIQVDCQTQLATQKAYYEAQIKDIPNAANLKKYYEGIVADYTSKLDVASKEKGRLQNELASCQSGNSSDSIIKKIIAYLKKKLAGGDL